MSERYKSSPTVIGHGGLRSNQLTAPKKAKQHPVLPPLVFSQPISANVDFGVWPAQDMKKTDSCFVGFFIYFFGGGFTIEARRSRRPGV